MYKVVKAFTDLQDSNHVYVSGEPYPRNGYTPTEDRIAELAGDGNKLGYPLIIKVKEITDTDVLDVPVTETPKKATEEAKEAASGAGVGENSHTGSEAKKNPKKARGKTLGKE